MLSRRKFLGAAGGVAGATAVGGGAWAALIRDSVEESASTPTSTTARPATTTTSTTTQPPTTSLPVGNRVLVLVQMAGGNDGLNTLIPASGLYRDARPTLAIPESELVELGDTDFSLHPSLAPLSRWWNLGSLAAVDGVGIPLQSRSHFKSMDTWWSGVAEAVSTTGWLGRWLDATLTGDPDPLRAIALGGGAPALIGEQSLATVIRSPQAFQLQTTPGTDSEALIQAFLSTASPLNADPYLALAQQAIPTTVESVELLSQVFSDSSDDTSDAGRGPEVLFRSAARIIDLGLGTQVITIGLDGYDTHADQLSRQSNLLEDLSAGIAAFMEQIEVDGHADEVTLMTTSEFGRRVVENGSGGTDHGQGGVQFVMGPSVNGRAVHGDLDLTDLADGDVRTTVDERSIYAEVLDWLGGPTDDILDGAYERIGVLAA